MQIGELAAITSTQVVTVRFFKDQPEENCGEVNELLDDHIQHVGTRIKELRKLETELKALRSACGHTQEAMRCGILKPLSATPIAAVEVSKSHVGHVHGGPRKAARQAYRAGPRREHGTADCCHADQRPDWPILEDLEKSCTSPQLSDLERRSRQQQDSNGRKR